jgi:hypothetical protein
MNHFLQSKRKTKLIRSRINEGFYFLILKNRSDFDDFFLNVCFHIQDDSEISLEKKPVIGDDEKKS